MNFVGSIQRDAHASGLAVQHEHSRTTFTLEGLHRLVALAVGSGSREQVISDALFLEPRNNGSVKKGVEPAADDDLRITTVTILRQASRFQLLHQGVQLARLPFEDNISSSP